MIAELVGPTTALWERQLAPTLVLGLTRVRATLDTAALAQRALVLFETLLLFFFFFFFSSSSFFFFFSLSFFLLMYSLLLVSGPDHEPQSPDYYLAREQE